MSTERVEVETRKTVQLEFIRNFVLEERKRLGIKSFGGRRFELSCEREVPSEYQNILWRKLLYTPERDWIELQDQEILNGVYREVLRITADRESAKMVAEKKKAEKQNINGIPLNQKWIDQLTKLPESGMGYQIIDVHLRDGRILERVFVFNAEMPTGFDFTENDIADITLSK